MGIFQGLCSYNGLLYAAWKGETGDDRLFYSYFDGHSWSTQKQIPGSSNVGPALATMNGQLYAAWKSSDKQSLFCAAFDGISGWDNQNSIPGNSDIGPALASVYEQLYAAWKGESSDNRLFYSYFDGHIWSTQKQIPGSVTSSYGPSLATLGGMLYTAWIESDQSMWYTSFDGQHWFEKATIPGAASSYGPSLATLGGKLYAAWKGVNDLRNNDQSLYYASFDGQNWSGKEQILSVTSSIGPSLAEYNGNLYAMWKGADDHQSLHCASFDGSHWSLQLNGVPGNTGQEMVLFPGGPYSSYNYILYSDGNPIIGLVITIDIKEDIVTQSSGAFGFQLNCNSPRKDPPYLCNWQQYPLFLTIPPYQGTIGGGCENWQINGNELFHSNPGPYIAKFPYDPKLGYVLPAGYKLQIFLGNDSDGNINCVNYAVFDNHGTKLPNISSNSTGKLESYYLTYKPTIQVTKEDLAPIVAFQLNLICDAGNPSTIMSSGKGTITYTASSPLTALIQFPEDVADPVYTAESANSIYGLLPLGAKNALMHSFGVNNPTLVTQVTPIITWNNPPTMFQAAALSNIELNATASDPVTGITVLGTFSYNPPAGTRLNVGKQRLNVLFTPNETATYNTASASVSINVILMQPLP